MRGWIVRLAVAAAMSAGAALALPGSAGAATLSQSQTFSTSHVYTIHSADILATSAPSSVPGFTNFTFSGSAPFSDTLHFTGFDSALGTLTGVGVQLTSDQTLTGGVSGVATDGDIVMQTNVAYQSALSLGGSALASMADSWASRHAIDLGCIVGANPCFDEGQLYDVFDASVAPAALSAFQASDVALDLASVLRLSNGGGFFTSTNPTLTASSQLDWSGTVDLTYDYTPAAAASAAPEPAQWALLLIGAGAIGALARRRPRTA